MANHLIEPTLDAQAVTEYFKMQLQDYQREVVINITSAAVSKSSMNFSSSYDGYLGIQPWGNDVGNP